MKALFDETMSGKGRLVMVVGEPGIGKTRLTEELGVYTAVRGAQVCWGHCYEGELGVPYLPFVEALRTYVRDKGDDELRAELSTGAPEVATIVSDLRVRFPDLPVSPALEGDAERMRLFEGVSAFLTNAAAARPLVLMLDDLHWADKPTLLLLQYLARNLRRERVLIVCTYRDVELDRTHPLADMIASLRREQLYERVLLRGLDRDEVKSFIEAVGEQETPAIFAETVHRETEGNPFFVAEILRHLAESGALERVDGHWAGSAEGVAEQLPEGVREVIGRRLSRLGDDCNKMLTIGAAMPGGFTLEVVSRVLDTDEDAVLDLLDEALDRQILRERRDQSGHVRVQPRADPPDPVLGAEHAPPHSDASPDPGCARRALRRAHRRAPHRARVSRVPGRAGRRRRQGGRLRDARRRSRRGVGRARGGRAVVRPRAPGPRARRSRRRAAVARSCCSRSATHTTTRASPIRLATRWRRPRRSAGDATHRSSSPAPR